MRPARIGSAWALALVFVAMTARTPPAVAEAVQAPKAAGVCVARPKAARLNFTLKDLDGRNIAFSDFKGKVIVLDFWATWCGPCKVEIPGFVQLQARYGGSGLQMLGVSVDDSLEMLKPYAAAMKMNYPVLQGRGRDEVLDAYTPVGAVPTSVVIGRDGTICRTHVGMTPLDEFEKEIKALLAL